MLGLAPRAVALRVLGLAPLVIALVVPLTPARGASPSPARNQRGMVVTSQVDATKAGVAMLEAGGNAIDAAVAAAFALGVVYPFYTGIGGGAFIVLRLADGTVVAIDARETAPAAASRDMFAKPGVDKSDRALNVATPGFLAGLALALERFGTMSLSEVLQPAIRLARDGFPIDSYHARMIARARDYLPPERFPETARIQFPP